MLRIFFTAIVCSLFLLACQTLKVSDIPATLTADELIQKAQEASDRFDYDSARIYYQALGERFASDPEATIVADYETAFIYYKQGNYNKAEEAFIALIKRYDGAEGSSLPPSYKILAEKVLPKVQAKLGKAQTPTTP